MLKCHSTNASGPAVNPVLQMPGPGLILLFTVHSFTIFPMIRPANNCDIQRYKGQIPLSSTAIDFQISCWPMFFL